MSSLSIRTLPKDIAAALRDEARLRKTTKTEIVLRALEERFHLGDRERRRQKIRKFFGGMTKEQFEAFKSATAPFSEIDKELW